MEDTELQEGINAKRCGVCGELKYHNEFSLDRRNKTDGLQYRCKSCTKQYAKNNATRISKVKASYRKENKVEIARKEAEHRLRNAEKLLTIKQAIT